MKIGMKNMAGGDAGQIELNDSVFAAPINGPLMHQALVRQLSNARLGTHDTKTRGEVEGGGRKPWRQKGTGRARQGSTRAPNWVGGGTVFGPTPRKYTKSLPRKMQRAALRSALSAKLGAGEIVVLDKVAVDKPHTKTIVAMLKALGVTESSVLLVLPGQDEVVRRSARNVPNVKMLLSNYLNVRDLLGHDVVLMPAGALPQIETWLSVEAAAEVEEEAGE
jgi:large subunit ribosomal protein L4